MLLLFFFTLMLLCMCFCVLCRSLLKLRDFYLFFLYVLLFFCFAFTSFRFFRSSFGWGVCFALDFFFLLNVWFFSVSLCGFLMRATLFLISFVWFCLFFFSIPLFRLCLMLTMKDRENVSVCVFVFVWFVYLLILLIYFFYLVFFFGISLVTPLCTLHPSAPLALNSFFSCLLLYFTIF